MPEDVRILVSPANNLMGQFAALLAKHNVTSRDKFLFVKPHAFAARQVFFAGEYADAAHGAHPFVVQHFAGTEHPPKSRWAKPFTFPPGLSRWRPIAAETVSWQLSQAASRSALRQIMYVACGRGNGPPASSNRTRVLIVDRSDAPGHSRAVTNHAELVRAIKKGVPGEVSVVEYRGSGMTLENQIRAFQEADVVIAPHGAALGLAAFMPPGGAVIEMTYPAKEAPLIFMPAAISAGHSYWLSIARSGGHARPMVVALPDVVVLAAAAIRARAERGAAGETLAGAAARRAQGDGLGALRSSAPRR